MDHRAHLLFWSDDFATFSLPVPDTLMDSSYAYMLSLTLRLYIWLSIVLVCLHHSVSVLMIYLLVRNYSMSKTACSM